MRRSRSLLAALALALLATPTLAASGPPPGLAGSLVIVSSDASSVTLHAEQTGGTPVTLTVEHYCYQGEVYGGFQRVRFVGSADMTFDIGPRSYHGQIVTPTDCWALLEFFYSSARVEILGEVVTLP